MRESYQSQCFINITFGDFVFANTVFNNGHVGSNAGLDKGCVMKYQS
jgi:hypothetical protein